MSRNGVFLVFTSGACVDIGLSHASAGHAWRALFFVLFGVLGVWVATLRPSA